MLQHVEQGRRTEIDSLNGALLAEARELGIACPINEAIVLTVKSIEARRTPARPAGPRRGGAGGGGARDARRVGGNGASAPCARRGRIEGSA